MANVERWVPSWQWHVFSMGSVNTHNNLNMEKQNLTKNESIFLVVNYHLIKNARILKLDKLTAKELCSILILSLKNKPTSQSYFDNSFPNYTFDWEQIYFLPRIITINSYQPNFQYKIFHNILYLLYCQKISREENFVNQAFREIFFISWEFDFVYGQNRYLSFFLFLKKAINIQHFILFINQILCSSRS